LGLMEGSSEVIKTAWRNGRGPKNIAPIKNDNDRGIRKAWERGKGVRKAGRVRHPTKGEFPGREGTQGGAANQLVGLERGRSTLRDQSPRNARPSQSVQKKVSGF